MKIYQACFPLVSILLLEIEGNIKDLRKGKDIEGSEDAFPK